MSKLDRSSAAALAQETVAIVLAGEYVAPSGRRVSIGAAVDASVAGTRDYPPKHRLPSSATGSHDTRFQVKNETTLAAAFRLVGEGLTPVALNFASARNPGGGFLRGALAQEESLARASGLHACLVNRPIYDHHRRFPDALYTSWALYSPAVPVFRDEAGALLEDPWPCAFITAPAPNAKVVLERDPSRRDEVSAAMNERISRVLAIAVAHGHRDLVLGAWGSGVFGNDVSEVAALFHAALHGSFRGAFERVVFAVLDGSRDEHFIGPFRDAFERTETRQAPGAS